MDAVVANAVGVSRGEPNAEHLLRHCATLTPNVGVVGLVEADDVEAWDITRPVPDGWHVIHRGADTSKDGVLLAFDTARVDLDSTPRWVLGTPSDLPGLPSGEFVDRYWLVATLILDHHTPKARRRTFAVGHLPTRSNPDGYYRHMARALRMIDPDHALADWNRHRHELRPVFPRRQIIVPAVDVMGVVSRKATKARRPRTSRSRYSDHLVLRVAV